MNTTVVVRPVRFTDNLEPMQGFLETLGLRPRIMAEAGGWIEMVAGGGMVALHDAATSDHGATSGETRLASRSKTSPPSPSGSSTPESRT
jgi:hypothetical protein